MAIMLTMMLAIIQWWTLSICNILYLQRVRPILAHRCRKSSFLKPVLAQASGQRLGLQSVQHWPI
jgi:hypothetical protein